MQQEGIIIANGIQDFNQQIIKQGNFPGLFKLTQLNYRGPKNVGEMDESKSVSEGCDIIKTGLAIVVSEDSKVPCIQEYKCLQNLQKVLKTNAPLEPPE